MAVDFDRSLKMALSTGKIYFGLKEAKKVVSRGDAQLVIVSKNAPEEVDFGNVKVMNFKGSSFELGSACGKPFAISYITVSDPGKSDILRM